MSRPPQLFDTPDWQQWYAPVHVPPDIQAKVLATGEPVEWNNTRVYEGVPYPMLYLTRIEDGKMVTHLLPGSCQPVEGWLIRTPR